MDNAASEDKALNIVASSSTPLRCVGVRAACRHSGEGSESQDGKRVKRVGEREHGVEYELKQIQVACLQKVGFEKL
jgi:hypothetical protein